MRAELGLRRISALLTRRKHIATVALYGGANLLPKITTSVLAIVYTRIFSAEEYGNFAIFAAVLAFLAIAFDFGVNPAILRNYFNKENRSTAYLASLVRGSRLIMLAMLPVFAATLFLVWDKIGVRFTQVFVFVPALVLIGYSGQGEQTLATVCRTLEMPTRFAAGQLVKTLAGILFGLLLVFVLRLGVGGALLAMFFANVSGWIAYEMLLTDAVNPWNARVDWTAMSAALRFGIPLLPDSFAGWARLLAVRPILANLLPLSAVGLYSFASQVAAIPALLSTAVNLALTPVYFRRMECPDSTEFRDKVLNVARFYTAALLPVWAFVIAFCPEIIRLLAGPNYTGAAPFCAVLLCASFARFQQPFLLQQIQFLRQTWLQSAITASWSVLVITAVLLLTGRFGPMAAAWATVVADAGILASVAIAIRRHRPIDYPIFTGLIYLGFLCLLAAGTLAGPHPPLASSILLRLVIVFIAGLGSLRIAIAPNLSFIRMIAAR